MRIVCISGSPSPSAWSRQLLSAVADTLVARGCEVDMLDLRELPLPLLDTVAYDAGGGHPHPAGRELRARVAEADGVVLATSVHHASYSGLLKSALDHLEADAFVRKPVGLIANAGAQRGATIACEHLRSVVKALSGWATPTQVASAASDFDPQTRQLRTGSLIRRCQAMSDELVTFVGAMTAPRPLA
ncbi:NAD(P)H-dependent oxidoreductase [Streptomyces sp. NPDC086519]|uniref:NADPH-dependent FMN reductase n=1 Tax=Streptomyces sp. NPDC086519 TaxID=3154863 RepID=UPI00343348B0